MADYSVIKEVKYLLSLQIIIRAGFKLDDRDSGAEDYKAMIMR